MKICVIELTDSNADAVLDDERLTNFRRLMDCGLYGKLQPAPGKTAASADAMWNARTALWQPLAGACQQAIFMRTPECQSEAHEPATASPNGVSETADSARHWTLLIDQLMNPSWDYIYFADHALAGAGRTDGVGSHTTDYRLVLDDQIGRVLEMLDDQTALLVVGVPPQNTDSGFFLLAGPNCPINGEFRNASLADLAPTLLDLAGRSIPDGLPGRSLVAGLEKRLPNEVSADHERIVLDRLAGLGYV